MSATVVFLGKLADLAGEPSRELPAPLDWAQLLSALDPGLMAAVAAAEDIPSDSDSAAL